MEPIETAEYMKMRDCYQVVDVRTAAEFRLGSVWGSINVPMFNEEQRARIGQVYKRKPKAARFIALDLLGPQMPRFIRRIHGSCRGLIPLIVCWRGGMRSRFTVDLLQLAGVKARQLYGGYKAYRRHIRLQLEQFELHNPLAVLKGKTGTGKTELLLQLAEKGVKVLDLEGLAGHRGSAFGGFTGQPAVAQKDFDTRLYMKLLSLNGNDWLVLEGESKRIGNVYLPDFLWHKMRQAPVIEVNADTELRISRIVDEYAPESKAGKERINRALQRLEKKLAKSVYDKLTDYLDQEDYQHFVALILRHHYDNIYDFQLPGKDVLLRVDSGEIKKAAKQIADMLASTSDSPGKTWREK